MAFAFTRGMEVSIHPGQSLYEIHASHGPFLDRQSGAEGTGQCGMIFGGMDAIQIPDPDVPCIAGSDTEYPSRDQEEGSVECGIRPLSHRHRTVDELAGAEVQGGCPALGLARGWVQRWTGLLVPRL